METKSSLKALQPVELRLAASFRLRREIARLTGIDEALQAEARDMTAAVIGDRAEVVAVMLDVIGKPFESDDEAAADAFGAGALEAFLDGEHGLRLESAPEPFRADAGEVPPAQTAAGAAPAGPAAPPAPPAQPQGAPQPQETGGQPQDSERQSHVEIVANRLADYDVAMPDDFLGVMFDALKRPEAELIMAEAALAVVDGLTLEASPYKADRGKVHWRRKLFEEAFAHFQANPPRLVEDQAGDGLTALPPAAVAPPAIAAPTAPAVPEKDAEALLPPRTEPVGGPDGLDGPETREAADAGTEASEEAGIDLAGDPGPDAEASDGGPEPDGAHGQHGGAAGEAQETTGRVIDFPVQAVRGQEPDADDVLDPFGAGPSLAAVRTPTPAPTLFGGAFEPASEDPLGETPPPFDDEADWGGSDEEADRLDREFAERTGYDRPNDGSNDRGEARLDPAAAAALADVVETPPAIHLQPLPSGGVPPRPAMPSLRSAPAVPPRPASPTPIGQMPAAASSPVPVAAAAPPARPSLAPGADSGVRVAPRPVAVRPPGM